MTAPGSSASGGADQTVDVDGQRCEPGATVVVTYGDGFDPRHLHRRCHRPPHHHGDHPDRVVARQHLLTATCGDLEQFLQVEVLVQGVVAPPVHDGSLLRSGTEAGLLAGIGAAAVVLGAAFAYGTRRPRPA